MRGPGLQSVQKGVGECRSLVLNCPLPGRGLSQKVASLESTLEKKEQAFKTGEAEGPLCPAKRCEHAQCVEKFLALTGGVSMRSVWRCSQTEPCARHLSTSRCHS